MSPLPSPLLLLLLLSLLPLLSLSQIQRYNSAPINWYTFDLRPPGPLNFTWQLGTGQHTGQAVFNGAGQYLDLRRTADDNNKFIPLSLPYTLSLEYWIQWNQLLRWSRIFECGQGIQMDNINVANEDVSPNLAVGIDSGQQNTRTLAVGVVKPTTWQHVAITLAQQTERNTNTGTLSVYVDGKLVINRTDSFLLKPVPRPHCWIGKSEYNPPLGTDMYFSGILDDFFYYDYPLSQEAILVHYVLPRPPVYELTFSTDPRLIAPQSPSYTYEWSDVDVDSSSITQYHNGHLVLRGDSFIDMMIVSGQSGVGAAALPMIGGASGANGTMPKGWTIEVLVKALTVETWAKIFDIGTQRALDNIVLGYVADTNTLRFEWWNNGAQIDTFTVLDELKQNTWYHIVIVLAYGANQAGNSFTSYVNGLQTFTKSGVLLPPGVRRAHAYIGKSHWPDEYFDCYLDAFRLYDYALTAQEVGDVYIQTGAELPDETQPITDAGYHTAPLASLSFNLQNSLVPYNHTAYSDGHYGIAQFNGRTDFIDLTKYYDDYAAAGRGAIMPRTIGGSMTFEVWVKFHSLQTYSRIFDLGTAYGSGENSIVMASNSNDPDLAFASYAGTQYGGLTVRNAIRVGQWQHIVGSVQQQRINDTTSATSGLFRIYIDGVLKGEANGFLPYTFTRTSSFLGKSNFATDALFNGQIDSFYFYDYALQYEQVAAHYALPRPPIFELAFTFDPRPWLGGGLNSYTYSWQEFDPNEHYVNGSQYHNGFLTLEGNSYVNLSATAGPSSVGTALPSLLFSPATGSGPLLQPPATANNGWSFEILVKLDTLENNTMIFDFGNGPTDDNVKLGYSGLERQLVFRIVRPNSAESVAIPIVTNTELGRWYHIIIVLRLAAGGGGQRAAITSFVDGVGPQTIGSQWMPRGIARVHNFLGKSNTPGVGYFDMKLDTFRIYDYALSTPHALKLYALTVAELPQLLIPLYTTAPSAQYTFDSQPDYSDGSYKFTWRAIDASHTGVAHFNGVDEFVNLMTFLDDAGHPFPAVWGNTSITFEAWVKFDRFAAYSRIFDFGNGPTGDNVMLSNFEDTSRIACHVYVTDVSNSTLINLPAMPNRQWVTNTWQHIVVTIEDQSKTDPHLVTRGRMGYDAALYSIYLQGSLIGQRRGYIPRAVERTQSYLAKSHWTADAMFQGSIDSFYYYNYALSGEQVNVRIVIPRPPVFDLSFSADPRLLLPYSSVFSYEWHEFDPEDSYANGTRYHTGHLVLDARLSQFVDLATPLGPTSVGLLLPRIGGRVPAYSGTTQGWSIEVIVKLATGGTWAKLLDWGNGGGWDNIVLGYNQDGNKLVFQVFNEQAGRGWSTTMTVIESVVLERWYHIVVVMTPDAPTGWVSTWRAYVDGALTFSEGNKLFPQSIDRSKAYLGKSSWTEEANPYFSAEIDAIRVYDYALSANTADQLYRLAHDPSFIPTPPDQSASSTAQGPTSIPVRPSTAVTGRPRPVSSTMGPGPNDFCEYGGVWPDRCECRCYTGFYPNCIPCPGEEPVQEKAESIGVGAVIGIIALILVGLALAVVAAIWWKNRGGRVTYSLDGGFSEGSDTDGWLNPAAERKAKVGGGGLLGGDVEDSSSTYDWQAYRQQGGREAQLGHWSS